MRAFPADVAVRRGLYDGLVVASILALVAFLTNVVFPGGPNGSDSDPDNMMMVLGAYLFIGVLLVVIGARGHRRENTRYAGAKAGAIAGFVIATLVMATFLVIDTLFFDTISHQHDKVAAFAASGGSSMRTFVNVNLLKGSAFLIPTFTVVGWALGLLGSRHLRRGWGSVTGPTR